MKSARGGAARGGDHGSSMTRCWREMDSNPRSPVSGAMIFWAFYVPVVIGQRPDSCGSREKTHIARIRAVSPSRWDREKPLFLQR